MRGFQEAIVRLLIFARLKCIFGRSPSTIFSKRAKSIYDGTGKPRELKPSETACILLIRCGYSGERNMAARRKPR